MSLMTSQDDREPYVEQYRGRYNRRGRLVERAQCFTCDSSQHESRGNGAFEIQTNLSLIIVYLHVFERSKTLIKYHIQKFILFIVLWTTLVVYGTLTDEGSCGQAILQCSSQPTHMWKNPRSELL